MKSTNDGRISYRWQCVPCDRFRGTAFCPACGTQAPTRIDRDVDRLADLHEASRHFMSLAQSSLNTAKAYEADPVGAGAMWGEEELAKMDVTRKNTAGKYLRWALAMEWAAQKLSSSDES